MPEQPNNMRQRLWVWAAACLMVLLSILSVWQAVNSAKLSNITIPASVALDLPTAGAVKIRVEAEGVYQLGELEFRRLGILPEQVESSDLRLSWRGFSIPFWLEKSDGGFRLLFYASQPSNPYSRSDYYWLTWGDESPDWLQHPDSEIEQNSQMLQDIAILPAIASKDENTVIFERILEQQINYSPQVESGDRFMWKTMAAPADEDYSLDLVDLPAASSELAEISLDVWASTEARVEPDHLMDVFINGEEIASQTWDGRGRRSFTFQFPVDYLKEGANSIRIALPGNPDIAADIVSLDRMVVHYPGELSRQQEQAIFWGANSRLTWGSSARQASLFDISNPLRPSRIVLQPEQSGQTSFYAEAGKRYLALWEGGAYPPSGLEPPRLSPDLRDLSLAAEYVAIGPADLLGPLEPLLALRREQGLSTLMVEERLIYDQFGYGYPEPQAITEFLRNAHQAWAQSKPGTALRFVLLVGDGSYDPRGYISSEQVNRLPTFLVDTVYGGQTATDVDFVQFNDDPWPDAALGRLPAQSAPQVKNYVDKAIRYEQNLSQSPEEIAVRAIADGQEASFAVDAGEFLKLFPEHISTELYSPSAGAPASNEEVRKIFRDGSSIIAYFGHGSVNMWGKDRLFTVEDVAALEDQEQFTIVLNLTCLTGLFTHPKVESLAEALLWKENAGAVAVLAPSSLTLPFDQTFLSAPLAQALAGESGSTLGEIHLAARRQIPVENNGSRDVMLTFMLFGDPALRMK